MNNSKYHKLYEELKRIAEADKYDDKYKIEHMRHDVNMLPAAYPDTQDYVYLNWNNEIFSVVGICYLEDAIYAQLLGLPRDSMVEIITVKDDKYYNFYYYLTEEERDVLLPFFFDLLSASRKADANSQKKVDMAIGAVISNIFLKNIDTDRLVLDEGILWVPKLGIEFYQEQTTMEER